METDEELIQKIQNGDVTAEIDLITKYKDYVVKICRGYFIVGGEMEDIIQEGMIGLYRAIKSFDPARKEASFKTYAITCIKHQIHNAIKKANTNKNKPLSTAVSLQSFAENNKDTLPVELVLDYTPANSVIEKENYSELQNSLKTLLSPQEYKVLGLYLQGYSYSEISKILNVQTKSIDNSLSRIKQKLRQKLKIDDIGA